MLGPNTVLVSALSLLVGQAEYPSCSLGKAFHASHNFYISWTQLR